MKIHAASLLIISLTAALVAGTPSGAVEPRLTRTDGFDYRKPAADALPLPGGLKMIEPSILLPLPDGEAVAITRSRSSRRAANPDADLTVQLRRWQGVASSAGLQPYTWGIEGDASARVSLGLLSSLFYTDNVNFTTDNLKQEEVIFELSPIIKIELGDPSAALSSKDNQHSEYYASMVYLPTFYYHLKDETDDYAQHFLWEAGRVNEVSRSLVRLDYDERILASSENTMPETNYTLLDASALTDYRVTQRTLLRGKATYRKISVSQAITSRAEWVGDLSFLWDYSPKTRMGLGVEAGHILYDAGFLGSQNYQQALVILEWKPSQKIGLTTRTGTEWRQFERQPSKSPAVSLVTLTTMYWQATDKTRLNMRFRVANQPSVVAMGALYREIRFGPELIHEFNTHYYAASELQVIRRHYDSGRRDWEPFGRVAIGYRDDDDKARNRINIELFLQWHRRERNDLPDATLQRIQTGIQVTRFF